MSQRHTSSGPPRARRVSIPWRSRETAADSAPVRAGASPSQKGMLGGSPRASSTRTTPCSTRRVRHEVLPSWKISPAMLSMAKSSLSVPTKPPPGSSRTS